jgi:(2Fe-2S) ferredoxin
VANLADEPSTRLTPERPVSIKRFVPIRKHYLFVCNNRRPDGGPRTSCQAQGSLELFAELKRAIGAAGLAQEQARCVQTGCLDCCDDGPAVLLEPEHVVYGKVQLSDVPEIVDGLRTGIPVRRLVVAAAAGEPERSKDT